MLLNILLINFHSCVDVWILFCALGNNMFGCLSYLVPYWFHITCIVKDSRQPNFVFWLGWFLDCFLFVSVCVQVFIKFGAFVLVLRSFLVLEGECALHSPPAVWGFAVVFWSRPWYLLICYIDEYSCEMIVESVYIIVYCSVYICFYTLL